MKKDAIFRLMGEENGQTLVLFAILLTVLLGITAFTVDFGYLFYQKRHLQNTADSSALAASWVLPNGNVQSVAEEYANSHQVYNDAEGTSVEATVIDSRNVKVVVKKEYPRLLGKVFGNDHYLVSASAVSTRDFAGLNIAPFTAVNYQAFKNDNEISDEDWENEWKEADIHEFYDLMEDLLNAKDYLEFVLWSKTYGDVPGNWGLLDLEDYADGSNNIGDVLDKLAEGELDYSICDETYKTGDKKDIKTVDTEPGQVTSIVKGNNSLKNMVDAANERGGIWLILATPDFADGISGKTEFDVPGGVIFAFIEEFYDYDLNEEVPYLRGRIVDVIKDCPNPQTTDWLNIYLIE